MHKLKTLFESKPNNILNIYFTAGYPNIDSLENITTSLAEAKVDIIEIGMPYSDPMADGETIQMSSEQALKNGMNLDLMFEQISTIRLTTSIPIILMGYLNQVIKYGEDRFISACKRTGVDGLIIPDLPFDIYETEYQEKFQQNDLSICFLVTPQTSDERIKRAASLSSGFLYVVSRSSITGKKSDIEQSQIDYFKKINALKGETPSLVGFGIHDRTTFDKACLHANGAIIGSQFIRHLASKGDNSVSVKDFIGQIR